MSTSKPNHRSHRTPHVRKEWASQPVLLESPFSQELRKDLATLHSLAGFCKLMAGHENIQLGSVKETRLVKMKCFERYALRLSHLCFISPSVWARAPRRTRASVYNCITSSCFMRWHQNYFPSATCATSAGRVVSCDDEWSQKYMFSE